MTSSAMTTSSWPATQNTSAPAAFRSRAACNVGNDWPECDTAKASACRHAVEAFIPGGKTVSDGVAPLQVMALWQAVNAAKALLDEATTMRKEGHAARKFTAHCSATQSEHSTPMMTRSKCALERRCASNNFEENVDAVALFGPSSKDRVIACKTPGKSLKSLPTTSPPNCEGLTGLAMSSDTPSKSSSVAKV